MKITVKKPWTFRGIGERGPIHIDYKPGMHNVPRHIAAAAIEAGVAHEYKDKGSRRATQEDAGAAEVGSGEDQASGAEVSAGTGGHAEAAGAG